jgi:hypothetical protein
MTWAPQEVSKTIYDLLVNDVALQTLLGGTGKVFDHVPDNYPFPYVTFDGGDFADRSNTTWRGFSAPLQIDVWYRAPGRGRKDVQLIQKRIDEILHAQDICIEGWNIVSSRIVTTGIIVDADNVTLHGYQIFNLLIGEA